MRRNPQSNRQQIVMRIIFPATMLIGLVFAILGKNTLDPEHLFVDFPQNDLYLWISATAFCMTLVLYSAMTILVATTEEIPIGRDFPSRWYQEMRKTWATWLAYNLLLPSALLWWIFGNLVSLCHLELFRWLQSTAFLVFIVTEAVQIIMYFKGRNRRAKERELERNPYQWW